MSRTIEPYRDSKLPERFLRWIETLRSRIGTVPSFTYSSGDPNGVIAGQNGDLYFDTVALVYYFKTTDTGNLGWVQLASGGAVVNGFSGLGQWNYRTAIDAFPSSGRLQFDNATIGSATNLYVHIVNDGGVDVSAFLALVNSGDLFYVQISADASQFVIIEVGTPVLIGSVYTFPITTISGQGTAPSNNTNVNLVISNTGGGGGGADILAGTVDGQIPIWDQTTDLRYEPSSNILVTDSASRINFGNSFQMFSPAAGVFQFNNGVGTQRVQFTEADGGVIIVNQNAIRLVGNGGIGNARMAFWSSVGGRPEIHANAASQLVFDSDGGGVLGALFAYPIGISGLDGATTQGNMQLHTVALSSASSLYTRNVTSQRYPVANYGEISYRFNNPTAAADPGPTFFRQDNVLFSGTNNLFFADEDYAGNLDRGDWFASLNIGDIIIGRRGASFNFWAIWQIDSVTDNVGWWTVGVTLLDSQGTTYVNGQDVQFEYIPAALWASGVAGDVFKVGTPVNNQIGVWTGDGTIEGDANFTWEGAGTHRMTLTHNSFGRDVLVINIQSGNSPAITVNTTQVGPGEIILELNPDAGTAGFRLETSWFGVDADHFVRWVTTAGVELLVLRQDGFATLAQATFDQPNNTIIFGPDVLTFVERAAALAPSATIGQFWVRDDAPNVPMFTDDAGTDYVLNAGGGGTVTSSGVPLNNEVAVFTTATDIDSDASFTYDGTTLEATQFAGIAKANLLDKSATEIITLGVGGSWTFTGDGSGRVALDLGTDLYLESNDGTTNVIANHNNADFRYTTTGARFNAIPFYVTGFLDLRLDQPIKIKEQATADPFVATYGQLWVKTATPNELWFSDDAGTDFQLSGAGTVTGTGANNQVAVWSGASSLDGTATFTWDGVVLGIANQLDVGDAFSGQFTSNSETFLTAAVNGSVGLRFNNVAQLNTQQHDLAGNTSGAQVQSHSAIFHDIGFNTLPQFNVNASHTLQAGNCGHMTGKTGTGVTTLTGPTSADVDFPVDGVTTVMNLGSSVDYTIVDTASCTMFYCDGTAAPVDIAGTSALAPGGIVTLWRQSATAIYIFGTGFTP